MSLIFGLIAILSIISIICFSISYYSENDSERKGLKLVLSLLLSVMFSFIIHATKISLLHSGVVEGMPLIFIYFVIPPIIFSLFQALLYDIRFK